MKLPRSPKLAGENDHQKCTSSWEAVIASRTLCGGRTVVSRATSSQENEPSFALPADVVAPLGTAPATPFEYGRSRWWSRCSSPGWGAMSATGHQHHRSPRGPGRGSCSGCSWRRTVALVVLLAPSLFALLPSPQGVTGGLASGGRRRGCESHLATGGQSQTFGAWITSLIPSNPIAAVVRDGAPILFTLLLALALRRAVLSRTRTPLVDFFRALGDAMLHMR